MANIFQLFGTIFVDNTEANKSIDTTTQKGENAGSKLGKAFSTIGSAAVKMGKMTVGAASAVSVGVYKLASSTSQHADEIDKMSQKLGMSKTAYQEWDYVLSQSGVEITSMSTGLKTLTNKLDDAKNGSDKAGAMFSKLGLSMSDLQSMSREDVFNTVIKGFQGMEDSTERAALANDLFGKSGQELAALFNTTAKATDEMKKKAHELGMVMTDEAVQSGVDLVDTLDTAKRSIGGVKNALGSAAIPIVQKYSDILIKGIPKIQSLFQRVTPIVAKLFDGIIGPLFDLMSDIGPVLLMLFETFLPVLSDLSGSILPVIAMLIQQLIPPLLEIAQQVLPVLMQLITSIAPIISTLAQTVIPPLISIVQALIPPLLSIIESVIPPIISLLEMLAPIVEQIINGILPVLLSLIEQIMPLAMQIIEQILPPIISLIESLLPPIMEIIEAVLPILIELINNILLLATEIIQMILPVAISLLETLAPVIQLVLDLLKQILDPITQILRVLLPPLIGLIQSLFSTLLPSLEKAFKTVSNVVIGPVKTALIAVKAVITSVQGALSSVINFIKNVFTGDWKGAWEAIKNLFGSIFGGIVELFKAPINFIIDGLNMFIDGLNLLQIPDWVPVVGGLGLHIPNIPKLRIGIEYVPHDDFPAILHKGEQVLTAHEREEYQRLKDNKDNENRTGEKKVEINVSVNIDKIENATEKNTDDYIELIMEKIDEAIKRKGVVFS